MGAKKVAEALAGVSGVDKKVIADFQTMLVDGMGGNMKKGESMTIEVHSPSILRGTRKG